MDDPRFSYEPPPPWRAGGKQILHGTEFTTMEHNNQFGTPPQKLDFELDTKRPVLCDLNTRFKVSGEFQVGKKQREVTWSPGRGVLSPTWPTSSWLPAGGKF